MAAAAAMLFVAASAWALTAWRDGDATVASVRFSDHGFLALDAAGEELWRHQSRHDGRPIWLPNAGVFQTSPRGVLVATSMIATNTPAAKQGGELAWFSADGRLARTWELDDRLAFASESFGPPWAITDVQSLEAGGRRLHAVAAHHLTWWPGLVTVLDAEWRRAGTFVNAGWIEQVRWLSPDRLLVAGFSNEEDGGIVALLDVAQLTGQSPANDDGPFKCSGCGDASPLRYVVFPRSEINRVAGGDFNRAVVEVRNDRVIVHTIELYSQDKSRAAAAVYELDFDLAVRGAAFSDRYWDEHRAHESRGLLRHDRAHCDEAAPAAIRVWEPKAGWRTLPLRDLGVAQNR